jgi:hypothetical protein
VLARQLARMRERYEIVVEEAGDEGPADAS